MDGLSEPVVSFEDVLLIDMESKELSFSDPTGVPLFNTGLPLFLTYYLEALPTLLSRERSFLLIGDG